MSVGHRIRVNGIARPLDVPSIAQLLHAMGLADRQGIAVAVNGAVIPRTGWSELALAPDDEVEIVGAAQGG